MKKNPKVLFDGTAIQSIKSIKFHGGSEYGKLILIGLLNAGINVEIVLNQERELDDFIEEKLQSNNVVKHFINNKKDIYRLADGFDIFYSPLPYSYFDYDGTAMIKGTIHGLRELEFFDKDVFNYIIVRRKWETDA